MQWDFTHDVAGLTGKASVASPRWLRLTRSGDTVTGYDSADGAHWTQVGKATLTGLPATVQVGLFATSPISTVATSSFGGSRGQAGPSQATGVFDHLSLSGSHGGGWAGTKIGGGPGPPGDNASGFAPAPGPYMVAGSRG